MSGGHRDVVKDYLVHGAQTLQATSMRLILSLSSMLGFKSYSTDVKLACLQSATAFTRDIYIKNAAEELELEPTSEYSCLNCYMASVTLEIIGTELLTIIYRCI